MAVNNALTELVVLCPDHEDRNRARRILESTYGVEDEETLRTLIAQMKIPSNMTWKGKNTDLAAFMAELERIAQVMSIRELIEGVNGARSVEMYLWSTGHLGILPRWAGTLASSVDRSAFHEELERREAALQR